MGIGKPFLIKKAELKIIQPNYINPVIN